MGLFKKKNITKGKFWSYKMEIKKKKAYLEYKRSLTYPLPCPGIKINEKLQQSNLYRIANGVP